MREGKAKENYRRRLEGGFVRACLQLGSKTAATEAAAMGVDSSGNVRRKV